MVEPLLKKEAELQRLRNDIVICKMFHEAVKRKKLKDNAELVNLQMAINALVEQANALDASHEQLK